MRSRILSSLAVFLILVAAIYWLIEERVAALFGVRTRDNCFTWAMRQWRYGKREFIAIGKSQSAWFPHVRLFRETEDGVDQIEYVPRNRENLKVPPRKFDGIVLKTRFYRTKEN